MNSAPDGIRDEDYHLCAQRWFEDFRLEERFPLPPRTMTAAMFAAFQLASGDNHPIHYDQHYCQRHGLPGMLAHGFQILIQTAAGAGLFPHMLHRSLKAFIEQSSVFLAPVFVDDTLYTTLMVSSLSSNRTTGVITLSSTVLNQHGECVMKGEHKYLVRRREALSN